MNVLHGLGVGLAFARILITLMTTSHSTNGTRPALFF